MPLGQVQVDGGDLEIAIRMNEPWRVIIVGGGFGGLRAAQVLKSDVVLSNKRQKRMARARALFQFSSLSLLSEKKRRSPIRSRPRQVNQSRIPSIS
jgi:NADH dehydrogenase FAD-containing subunit